MTAKMILVLEKLLRSSVLTVVAASFMSPLVGSKLLPGTRLPRLTSSLVRRCSTTRRRGRWARSASWPMPCQHLTVALYGERAAAPAPVDEHRRCALHRVRHGQGVLAGAPTDRVREQAYCDADRKRRSDG